MPLTIAPTALIVDDSTSKASMVRGLQSAGYRVTSAATYEQAGAILAAEPFDILITEVRLGAFNGLQLVVKARARNPEVMAIILTTYPDAVLEAEARHLGATFVVRPVQAATLVALLSERVPGQPERRTATRRSVTGPLDLDIANVRATVVDVGYGGLRVALSGDKLPSEFQLRLPAMGFSAGARLVWAHRSGDVSNKTLCGVMITDRDSDTLLAWRRVVDAV